MLLETTSVIPSTTAVDAMQLHTTTTVFRHGAPSTSVSDTDFSSDDSAEFFVVNVHPEIEYQTIRGFGGAITEAAGHTLLKMSPERRAEVLEAYFGEDGHHYSVLRTHLDSSDFSLGSYEAEPEDDPTFSSFSLARDEHYILPFITHAEEIAGRSLEVMLTPWSPPAYMKTNGSRLLGGSLKPEYRQQWAEYIAHYIGAYRERGINVTKLTVQNEPDAAQSWDSCLFTAEEEKVFLRDFLHPALVAAGLGDVAVIIDESTAAMVAGVAFHWYTGDHFDGLRLVRERFPDVELVFSEGCVEYSRFGADQLANAEMYAHDIIGNLNAGMNTFIDWNIVLDEEGGPNHVGNYCDAPVMCNTADDTVEFKLSYHYIGHFSRFLAPGARRIATSTFSSRLEVVAARNPDSTIAIIAMNPTDDDITARVRIAGRAASLLVPAHSIASSVVTGL
jgi:glucosylceramidase